jgi:hypothetical protein
MTRLTTGDLVLFTSAPTWRAWLFGPSGPEQFTRVGMVLVDPPAPFAVPRGTYLWPGLAGLTGLTELGAAIGDSAVVVRKCTLRVPEQRLLAIHADLGSVSGRDSELVAYVLTRLGWLSDATDCTAVRPCDLSSRSTRLAWDVGSAYMRDAPYAPCAARGTEPAASLCDALVAKLASIGVPAARVSESEARIGLPRGALVVLCAPGPSFVARATDRSPRAFDSQGALVRYVTEVLDAHLLAVIS